MVEVVNAKVISPSEIVIEKDKLLEIAEKEGLLVFSDGTSSAALYKGVLLTARNR